MDYRGLVAVGVLCSSCATARIHPDVALARSECDSLARSEHWQDREGACDEIVRRHYENQFGAYSTGGAFDIGTGELMGQAFGVNAYAPNEVSPWESLSNELAGPVVQAACRGQVAVTRETAAIACRMMAEQASGSARLDLFERTCYLSGGNLGCFQAAALIEDAGASGLEVYRAYAHACAGPLGDEEIDGTVTPVDWEYPEGADSVQAPRPLLAWEHPYWPNALRAAIAWMKENAQTHKCEEPWFVCTPHDLVAFGLDHIYTPSAVEMQGRLAFDERYEMKLGSEEPGDRSWSTACSRALDLHDEQCPKGGTRRMPIPELCQLQAGVLGTLMDFAMRSEDNRDEWRAAYERGRLAQVAELNRARAENLARNSPSYGNTSFMQTFINSFNGAMQDYASLPTGMEFTVMVSDPLDGATVDARDTEASSATKSGAEAGDSEARSGSTLGHDEAQDGLWIPIVPYNFDPSHEPHLAHGEHDAHGRLEGLGLSASAAIFDLYNGHLRDVNRNCPNEGEFPIGLVTTEDVVCTQDGGWSCSAPVTFTCDENRHETLGLGTSSSRSDWLQLVELKPHERIERMCSLATERATGDARGCTMSSFGISEELGVDAVAGCACGYNGPGWVDCYVMVRRVCGGG